MKLIAAAGHKVTLYLNGSMKNNMHQNNTYFCDEFLRAVCFQMKRAKNYQKKRFKMADISMFFRDIERTKYYDAITKDLPCEKIGELVSKSKSYLLKVSRGEIADCWRDIVYKYGACERFPNKTREYMKNFDKFGGFTNNQIKIIIFMLRTVTEDLDDAMEVLLQKV